MTEPVSLSAAILPWPVLPIQRATLAEQVAEHITEAIAARRLLPGQRLTEAELAHDLGVSRVPVREALKILSSQALVTVVPRRGVHVASFDARWAQDLRGLRYAIERQAMDATLARLRSDPAAAEAATQAVAQIGEAARAGDRLRTNRADLAFHGLLVEMSDSVLLQALWAALARHVLVRFGQETAAMPDLAALEREHVQFLEHLLSPGPIDLDAAMASHIHGSGAWPALPASVPASRPQPSSSSPD